MIIVGNQPEWEKLVSEMTLKRWPDDVYLIDIATGFPEGIDPGRCIVVSDRLSHSQVIEISHAGNIRHIVQFSHLDFEEEINLSARMICQPDHFLADVIHPLFGIENIDGTQAQLWVKSYPFSSSKQKNGILNSMRTDVSGFTNSSIAQFIISVADEMYTNAIFWGPQKMNRQSKFAKLRRDKEVRFNEGVQGELRLVRNTKKIYVGCTDPFGSLESERILGRLNDCYQKGVSSVINLDAVGIGGTGIGFYLMCEQGTNLVIGVKKNTVTHVFCEIPLRVSLSKFANMPKNLHILEC